MFSLISYYIKRINDERIENFKKRRIELGLEETGVVQEFFGKSDVPHNPTIDLSYYIDNGYKENDIFNLNDTELMYLDYILGIEFENKPIDAQLVKSAIEMDIKMGIKIDNIITDLNKPTFLNEEAKKKLDLIIALGDKFTQLHYYSI